MSLVLRVFRSIYVPTSLYLLFPCRVVAESLVAGAGGRAGRVLRLFHVLLPAPAALRAEMCSYLRAEMCGTVAVLLVVRVVLVRVVVLVVTSCTTTTSMRVHWHGAPVQLEACL